MSMTISVWHHHRNSSTIGKATVIVSPGEPADILKMIERVDGADNENYGVTVRCLGYADKPSYGGLPSVEKLREQGSSWEVTVLRD